jgi:hypothetical protein
MCDGSPRTAGASGRAKIVSCNFLAVVNAAVSAPYDQGHRHAPMGACAVGVDSGFVHGTQRSPRYATRYELFVCSRRSQHRRALKALSRASGATTRSRAVVVLPADDQAAQPHARYRCGRCSRWASRKTPQSVRSWRDVRDRSTEDAFRQRRYRRETDRNIAPASSAATGCSVSSSAADSSERVRVFRAVRGHQSTPLRR